MPLLQAQEMAREKDLDLVEISPSAAPPVCKIMDYGKYVFQQKKKQNEAKKKQKDQRNQRCQGGDGTGECAIEDP